MHTHELPNGRTRSHTHGGDSGPGSHEHGWGAEPPWAYFGPGDTERPVEPDVPETPPEPFVRPASWDATPSPDPDDQGEPESAPSGVVPQGDPDPTQVGS